MAEQFGETPAGASEAVAVLARVADRAAPPLGFSVDGLVAVGRRRARARRRRWAAGGAVGLAGVTLAAVALLPGAGGRGGVGPAPAARGPAPVDRQCAADVAAVWGPGEITVNKSFWNATVQACPFLRRMTSVLDPQGGHLGSVDAVLHRIPNDVVYSESESHPGSPQETGVGKSLTWTTDGHLPMSAADVSQEHGSFVALSIEIRLPGPDDGVPPGAATRVLPDGSTLWITHHGRQWELTRTLPSGRLISLVVQGPNIRQGMPLEFPFDEEQLVRAISVPGAADVVLPFAAR